MRRKVYEDEWTVAFMDIAKDVDGGGGPNDERNAQRHITDSRKDKIQYNFFRHGSNLP